VLLSASVLSADSTPCVVRANRRSANITPSEERLLRLCIAILIINGSKFENKGRVSELDLESSSGQDSAGCN
jgi:hypothetical protein